MCFFRGRVVVGMLFFACTYATNHLSCVNILNEICTFASNNERCCSISTEFVGKFFRFAVHFPLFYVNPAFSYIMWRATNMRKVYLKFKLYIENTQSKRLLMPKLAKYSKTNTLPTDCDRKTVHCTIQSARRAANMRCVISLVKCLLLHDLSE